MKVRELIEQLQKMPPDEDVVIGSVSDKDVERIEMIDEHRPSRLIYDQTVHIKWVEIS